MAGACLRLPFTAALLGALLATALVTGSLWERLDSLWLDRIGFAASDLWLLELERLFTSAFSTHGGGVFWQALLAVALFVGAAEWRAGSRRAALVFFGTHLLTLLVLSLGGAPSLRPWHPMLADVLHTTRDVGPSAGYFGAAALWYSTLPRRAARGAIFATALWLSLDLLLRSGADRVAWYAAVAHIVAFPIGFVLAWAPPPPKLRTST